MNKETNDDDLSPAESMDLIEQMIGAAKDDHNERGEGWLIWGWLLFVASIGSLLLIYTGYRAYIGWFWTALLPIGFIVYYFIHLRPRKADQVKTYISNLLNKIEAGFFISLVVIIAGSNIIGMYQHQYGHYLFGYYYILYAFWMFIHGSAIRFKPLIIGAYFNWASAIAIFFLSEFKYVMMISALAVLIGYIIPGYIQKQQYKRSKLTS
jgi:hypothetical protein